MNFKSIFRASFCRIFSMHDSQETMPEQLSGEAKSKRPARFLLVVAFIGVLVFVAHSWKSQQPLAEITVHGVKALTQDEVLKEIDSAYRIHPVDKVPLALVREDIEKNPLVRQAVVSRKGTRGIEIVVRERVPVAALVYDDGLTTLIDEEARCLPYGRFKENANVPLFRGMALGGKIDSAFLKNALYFLKNYSSGIPQQTVSEIVFDKKTNCYSLITEHGTDILLGNSENAQLALKKLAVFFKNSTAVFFKNTDYIDMRWKGRIITKPRRESA
jgi:cell division septal protein FtsQ